MKEGIISAIVQDPKQKYRYQLFVDGESAFDVHEDILVKYRLFKGKEVDAALLREICHAEEENKAYLAALRYIGIRPRSAYQLMRYLGEKGFSEELAQRIARRCSEQGYIDDEAYAKQWVAERLRLRPKGAYALKMELLQKGIAKPIVERAIGEIDRDEEQEAARKLLRSKLRRKSGSLTLADEQKLLSMLMRKGFSSSMVRQLRQELRSGKLLDYECDE